VLNKYDENDLMCCTAVDGTMIRNIKLNNSIGNNYIRSIQSHLAIIKPKNYTFCITSKLNYDFRTKTIMLKLVNALHKNNTLSNRRFD